VDSVRVCSFGSIGNPKAKETYEQFRDRALAVGKFSVFEATNNAKCASWYTRLCKDPEVEVVIKEYPWTEVKRK
jgi:hypothetical protein